MTYDGSDFEYAIGEIELIIENEADAPDAVDDIMAFADSCGLATDTTVIGKVGAYLRVERPNHYQVLVDANVF